MSVLGMLSIDELRNMVSDLADRIVLEHHDRIDFDLKVIFDFSANENDVDRSQPELCQILVVVERPIEIFQPLEDSISNKFSDVGGSLWRHTHEPLELSWQGNARGANVNSVSARSGRATAKESEG